MSNEKKPISERLTEAKITGGKELADMRYSIPPGKGPARLEAKAYPVWPEGVVLVGDDPRDAHRSAISINVGCKSPRWVEDLYHAGQLHPDAAGVYTLREILAWLMAVQRGNENTETEQG